MAVIITDNFTGTNGTNINGRTTTTGSKTWEAPFPLWSISSNALTTDVGDTQARVDSGVSNGIVSIKVITPAGYMGLSFRGTSSSINDCFVVQYDPSTFVHRLYQRNTWTLVATSTAQQVFANDTLSVVLNGTSIKYKVNSTEVLSTTSTYNQTSTFHGLHRGDFQPTYDDFSVDDNPSGGGSSVAGGGTLTGTGTLSGSGTVSISKGANLTATGSLTAAGVTSISGAASLTAIGSLTAAGSTSSNPVAGGGTLSASGTLTATYAVSISAGGTLTGTTSLTAAGVPAISGGGTLTAVGSLSAAGIVQVFGATLTAFGSLTAAGQVSISGRASLQASGTMTTRGLTKDPVYVLSTIKLYGEMVKAVSLSGDIDSVILSGDRDLTVKLSGSFSSAKLGGGV